jgi:molecular chaperone DnaJ
MTEKRDFYEILGVERDATDRDIKKAYRALALQYHPDRNPDDAEAEARFKEAAEAYAVLSDPEKRATYDRFGHAGLGGGAGPDINDIFSNFGDIFADFFGFGGGRAANPDAPRRGSDLQMRVAVPFEFAIRGGEKVVEVPRAEECERCEGSGAEPGTEPTTCPSCQGAGRVRHAQGLFTIQTTCPQCRGTGRHIADKCRECRGAGAVERRREVTVKIPPGVDTGNRLRLRAEGEPGLKGGPPGDLYIQLFVENSEVFERDGADLHIELPIHYTQAVLGTRMEIPTLEGTHTLDVKPGTKHGDIISVRGEGLPRVNGRGARGDLHIHLAIQIPKSVNKRERELLKQLAAEAGVDAEGPPTLFGRLKDIWGGTGS